MEHSNRAQSRLHLRLALAISESNYPVSAWRRRARGRSPKDGREDEMCLLLPEERSAAEDDTIPDSAWEHLESLRVRFDSELAFADSYLAEDPPSSRISLLLAGSSELRKVAILQRLIERAYSYRLHHPGDGLEIAGDLIAWTRTDPSPLVGVIRRRALMERGNLLRILGDPVEAYASLAEATTELEANGTSDPLEIAYYQEILGALERDCGNVEAAADLLTKALSKVRRWGDHYTLQRALNSAGFAALLNNNFEQADHLLGEAMRVEEPDRFFLECAAFNRLLGYYLNGKPHKAYQALIKVRDKLGPSWLEELPSVSQMRGMWIEGQILNALRSDDDATGILKRARELAIRLGLGCETCYISLDLALVYASQQRFTDIRRELAFALPFCSEQRPLDVYGKQVLVLLQAALQHRGRLETDQIRSAALKLDSLLRAPLRPLPHAAFATLQLS